MLPPRSWTAGESGEGFFMGKVDHSFLSTRADREEMPWQLVNVSRLQDMLVYVRIQIVYEFTVKFRD